jgi:hypothetical protein
MKRPLRRDLGRSSTLLRRGEDREFGLLPDIDGGLGKMVEGIPLVPTVILFEFRVVDTMKESLVAYSASTSRYAR